MLSTIRDKGICTSWWDPCIKWWVEMVVHKNNLAQVGGLTWWGNMVGFHVQIQDELQRGYELSNSYPLF